MEPLEAFLSFPQIAWVLNDASLAVGQKCVQPQVNANPPVRWLMHDFAGCLYCELTIIAIGSPHNPHPLDLRERERLDLLTAVTHESYAPDATAIREREMLPISFYLPPRVFVFDASIIMLELGIAFLAWELRREAKGKSVASTAQ